MANPHLTEDNKATRFKPGHVPATKGKPNNVQSQTMLLRNLTYDSIQEAFLSTGNSKKSKEQIRRFIDLCISIALKDPESKIGQRMASLIFHEGVLDNIDKMAEKERNKDLNYIRYLIQKDCFKEQRDVLLDGTLYKRDIIVCGRRSGKTELCARKLVSVCLEKASPCLYINLTFVNAIRQEFDLVLQVAQEAGLLVERSSKADGIIEFSNGSSISFKGNSNKSEADKLRGYKFKCAIIDECGHQVNLNYLVDEVLMPALSDYENSQIILCGTPPRIANTYAEQAWNNPKWHKRHWTMFENPFIPDAEEALNEVCEAKGYNRDAPFIQREWLGEMGVYDIEAMVFKDYKTYDNIPLDFKPTHICLGVDFGFEDYNAIVTLQYNINTRQAYVTEEQKFNKATISDIVNAISEQYKRASDAAIKYKCNNKPEIFCDNNEKSIIAELKRNYNLPAYPAWKHNKIMALEQLAEECRTSRMLIKQSGKLEEEFNMMVYKRDEQDNILPELDDDTFHGDITMALLYASRQYFHDAGIDNSGSHSNENI